MPTATPTHPAAIPPKPPSAWPIIVVGIANVMYALFFLAFSLEVILLRGYALQVGGGSILSLHPNPNAPPFDIWAAILQGVVALISLLLIVGSALVLVRKRAGFVLSFGGACLFLVIHSYSLLRWGYPELLHLVYLGWPAFVAVSFALAPTRRAIAVWTSGRVDRLPKRAVAVRQDMAHQFGTSLPVARSKARRRVFVIIAVVAVVFCLPVSILWVVPRFISVVAAVADPTYRHVETSEVRWTDGATFGEIWNDPTKHFYTSIFLGSGGGSDAQGTYLRIGDQDMVLSVLVPKNVLDEIPGRRQALAMQLAITSLVEVPSGAFLPQVYGNPPIVCDLNRLQADHVWQHGVPQSLIDEMVQTATKAGWKPIPPSGTNTFPGPTIIILPDPHFPADKELSEDSRE